MKQSHFYLFTTLIAFCSISVEAHETSLTLEDSVSLVLADTITLSESTILALDSALIQTSDSALSDELLLVFAGDIMGHDTQIVGAYVDSAKSYDYEPTYRYIKDYISSADVALGNLEVTLAGPPYKGYPAFSSPDELAFATRDAGFDVLVTANNHALDRGYKGFDRTLSMLDSLQFLRAGSYHDSLDRDTLYPLIFEKNTIRIALLNYTYGTNGLKIAKPYIINRIDTALIRKDLEKAKLAMPDYTIVFIHWGNEYERTENKTQIKLAEFMFENGADAIIGSHPHVVQPIKTIVLEGDSSKQYPVFYSMGNFVSNQRAQYKDGGIMAELRLKRVGLEVKLEALSYLPYWVWRQDRIDGTSCFYVLPLANYEENKDSFNLTPSDEYRLKRFTKDTREHLKMVKESDFYKKKEAAQMSSLEE